jgi:Zn-dependent M28 family amino/carboxypeptidase
MISQKLQFELSCLMPVILLLGVLSCHHTDRPKGETEPSPQQYLKLITPDGLKIHLTELASNKYEGRNAGYPGDQMATEYIADHFQHIGLIPVGDTADGKRSYFQHFEFVPRRPPRPMKKMKTRNVVGFVEGTDETLKHQVVVIGAHHDGQGKAGQADPGRVYEGDATDEIWNSADDNSSGTVAVLEIAHALMAGKVRTKRSILFMTFGAEEHGLYGEEALHRPDLPRLGGSEYYAAHPLFELKNHIAMINLEMVGRNPQVEPDVRGTATSPLWKEVIAKASEVTGLTVSLSPPLTNDTDHFAFGVRGIPAIHIGVGGSRSHYHQRHDQADAIAYDRLAQISRFTLTMAVELANRQE